MRLFFSSRAHSYTHNIIHYMLLCLMFTTKFKTILMYRYYCIPISSVNVTYLRTLVFKQTVNILCVLYFLEMEKK